MYIDIYTYTHKSVRHSATLTCTATCCNTLQHTATHCNAR